MKRFKAIIALTAVLAMTCTTAVMAAPSPTAGVVTVVVPGKGGAEAAQVTSPTVKELTALAGFISENAATLGMVPSVKTAIDIVAPAGYKGGDVPTIFAVAGLKDGVKNVFAYIRLKNGKTIIVPCTVKNGYVGFMAPAFGTVAIVELNTASVAMPAFGQPQAVPATLH
ncbi:MAG: hypothetical protein K6F73_08525 [Lachnospiraceae bacterium]|nr:hypothetical protein [Lachnospiraceae bacterium]